MKKINLFELKRALETEPAKALIYATNNQNRTELEECEYIHDFSMSFDSFEVVYLPAVFVLMNQLGRVVFFGVKYIEYHEKNKKNERIFTMVCKDRPFTEDLSRYNVVAHY